MNKLIGRMIWCAVALIVVVAAGGSEGVAQDKESMTGAVLKLSEITGKPFTINTGGLVVVIVRDSGSRPPQDIRVEAPRAYRALGTVRGTQNDQGQALMGGGYTWYLFTPVTAGETTFKVRYTENGEAGKKVERTYQVKVEARD